MQLHQYWGNMVVLRVSDEPCCIVLYHLEVFKTHSGMPKSILLLLSNFDVTKALMRVDVASSVNFFFTLLMLCSCKYEVLHTLFT